MSLSPRRSIRKKKRKVGPRAVVPEDEDTGENDIFASEPLKLLSDLRQQAQKNLHGQEQTKDLEFLVGAVRGIITTNKEIWERCKYHVTHTRAQARSMYTCPSAILARVAIASDKKFIGQVDMVKLSYHKVHAKKCPRYGSVNITTTKSTEYKTFASPPLIPASLTNTVPQTSCQEGSQPFPDYDAFFMAAVLLQNDVLASFLQTLQTHLEEIQVWLGAIESWILESQSIVDFLNNLFEKNLEIEDFTKTTSGDIQNGKHLCTPKTIFQADNRIQNFVARNKILAMEAYFEMSQETDQAKLEAFYKFVKLID